MCAAILEQLCGRACEAHNHGHARVQPGADSLARHLSAVGCAACSCIGLCATLDLHDLDEREEREKRERREREASRETIIIQDRGYDKCSKVCSLLFTSECMHPVE